MRDPRMFITVTEATRLADANHPDAEPLGFILVSKAEIRIVIPSA